MACHLYDGPIDDYEDDDWWDFDPFEWDDDFDGPYAPEPGADSGEPAAGGGTATDGASPPPPAASPRNEENLQ